MTQPKVDHYEAVRGPDNAPGSGPDDSIRVVTIDGRAVLAFHLRPGDVQSWDSANIGPNGQPNERAELSLAAAPGPRKGDSPYDVREGMTQTYDIDYRFAAGFPPHTASRHEWAMLTQFHVQDDHAAGATNGFGGVSFHDGKITLETPGAQGQYFTQEAITPDTWYRRRLVVRWTSGNDGFVKWLDRPSGTLIGGIVGVPTIAAGEFKYVKQGYYRAGGLPEATVYQTLMDIADGDLSSTEQPPQKPVEPPAPQDFATAHPTAEAGRQLLVVVQPQLEAHLLQLDAAIALLQTERDHVQKQHEAVVALLDKGPWT